MLADQRPPSRFGFTLIEVLVVMSIIALLAAILVPSATRAREQARAVVCLCNLKNLGNANAEYQTANNGYVPGSPLTTGLPLAVKNLSNHGAWEPRQPMNHFDFVTPFITQMKLDLPCGNDLVEYLPHMTKGVFHCPSNRVNRVELWPERKPAETLDMYASSYLTMNTMMRGGPNIYRKYRQWEYRQTLNSAEQQSHPEAVEPFHLGYNPSWNIVPADDYVPHIERIGLAAIKVFVADGLRFYQWEGGDDKITISTMPTSFAGFFSAQPPCDYYASSAEDFGGRFAREYNVARKYAYRHGGGKAIQAVMFDGHAQALKAEFSDLYRDRYARKGKGEALEPKHYFPSKSRVQKNALLFLRDEIPEGSVLP